MNSVVKKKILFVDDEPDWRCQVSGSLREAGYDVLTAGDASEALHQAEEPEVGLIIVDEDLAGESGIMLTKFLHENHPDVPQLFYMSQEHDDSTIVDFMEQGADQCLPKGSMEELIVTTGSYLR